MFLLFFSGIWKVVSSIFMAIPPILKLIAIGVVAVLGLWFYSGHLTHAKDEKIRLQQLSELKAHYEEIFQAQRDAQLLASQIAQAQNELLIEKQKLELIGIANQKEKVVTLVKKVKEYVTTKADANCTIPLGFVRMYNGSLAAPNTLSPSESGNVDAASGITLSTVAAISADNNGECVARGGIIQLWQEWYAESKKTFDKLSNSKIP